MGDHGAAEPERCAVKRLLRAAAALLLGSGVVFLIVWLLVDAILG